MSDMDKFLKPAPGSNKPTDMGKPKGARGEALPGVVKGKSQLDKEGGVMAKNGAQYSGIKMPKELGSSVPSDVKKFRDS